MKVDDGKSTYGYNIIKVFIVNWNETKKILTLTLGYGATSELALKLGRKNVSHILKMEWTELIFSEWVEH